MELRFGYNTNGFAHHELYDALKVIQKLGYKGVALTLDVCHCNPLEADEEYLKRLKRCLEDFGLAVVIETGARFLLDPFHKHKPTLISAANRDKRIGFLKKAITIAEKLGAEGVTFFSGIKKEGVPDEQAWEWLVEGCNVICKFAEERGVNLGFEPEPGMFVEDLSGYQALRNRLDFGNLDLTLDIGHIECTEKEPIPKVLEEHIDHVVSFHIEDIKDRVHNHLMFGEGDIDFYPIFQKLKELNYKGLINVELSRHSHMAPIAAEKAIDFLSNIGNQI